MKQLMELLGLDIPKWEGPTICERSAVTSECTSDAKPPQSLPVGTKVKKEQRKREADTLTDSGDVKEEALLKKEKVEADENNTL